MISVFSLRGQVSNLDISIILAMLSTKIQRKKRESEGSTVAIAISIDEILQKIEFDFAGEKLRRNTAIYCCQVQRSKTARNRQPFQG